MSDNDNTTDPEPIPDPVDPNDTTTPGTNLVFTDDQGATTTINTDTGESQGTVGVGGISHSVPHGRRSFHRVGKRHIG